MEARAVSLPLFVTSTSRQSGHDLPFSESGLKSVIASGLAERITPRTSTLTGTARGPPAGGESPVIWSASVSVATASSATGSLVPSTMVAAVGALPEPLPSVPGPASRIVKSAPEVSAAV